MKRLTSIFCLVGVIAIFGSQALAQSSGSANYASNDPDQDLQPKHRDRVLATYLLRDGSQLYRDLARPTIRTKGGRGRL